MAGKNIMWQFLTLFLVIICSVECKIKAVPIALTEETWTDMLEGEWLVEFYAPWCPACKAMAGTWENVAGWADDLSIAVANIDVTENPGLSGRFLVTALPTIYHVKNGEFRQYRGSREETDFISLVDDKKWEEVPPVAWYFHPQAMHMSALSMFFKLSIAIRDLHNRMTEEFGIPVWGSYTIFALATIVVGLVLGLIIVCLCDVVFPPKYPSAPQRKRPNAPRSYDAPKDEEGDSESDVIEDDRYDALDTSKGGDVRPKSAGSRKRVSKTD